MLSEMPALPCLFGEDATLPHASTNAMLNKSQNKLLTVSHVLTKKKHEGDREC